MQLNTRAFLLFGQDSATLLRWWISIVLYLRGNPRLSLHPDKKLLSEIDKTPKPLPKNFKESYYRAGSDLDSGDNLGLI
jgi:hypothetical protein